MSALPGSFEGTAVTGLDSSPVEPAAPDLPPLTAQHEAEALDLMARYPQARSALLPMLHLVQSVQGYVSPEGVGFCARLLGLDVGHQRSTPPMTGSIDATAAMTSATIPPSLIAGIVCRLTKLGSRTWTRSGRVPPSETRW